MGNIKSKEYLSLILIFVIAIYFAFLRNTIKTMQKTKLITIRKQKGFSQQQLADYLCMNVSSYNRREKGISHIKPDEWLKLAELLEVSVDEIYEADARYHINCKDQSIGINTGTQKVYTVPKALLDSQQKYIEMLEAKIKKLEED